MLVIGYAPWPRTWNAHLPGQFADTVASVCEYLEQALVQRSPERHRLRRRAYRALSDLRAENQRTLWEPPALSRRATTWWPAVVGLGQALDVITAAAVAADHGAALPAPGSVREAGKPCSAAWWTPGGPALSPRTRHACPPTSS